MSDATSSGRAAPIMPERFNSTSAPKNQVTAHHTVHTFGDDGAAPNTCWCRCPSCWDDRSRRCLCPACRNPYHHHGLDGRASL